jgi:Ca-activated chloride channel family protein
MRHLLLTLMLCISGSPALACETALVLAVDVSGSISDREYVLQINGIADALEDPDILAALVEGQGALAILQWSGEDRQTLALPWHRLGSADQVMDLTGMIRALPRPWNTSTSIGEAIRAAMALFAEVPDCRRRVIDVSGDGTENDALTLPEARADAVAAGITVNGLAIEVGGGVSAMTDYYRENVISPEGFVVTAKGIQDFPRAIHAKLLRELAKPSS